MSSGVIHHLREGDPEPSINPENEFDTPWTTMKYRTIAYLSRSCSIRFVDQFKGAEASLLSVCGEKSFKEALELSSSIAVPRYKLCYSPEANKADADAFKAALSTLDETIKGPYLMGEKLSLADLALFPFLNAWDFVMNRVLKMDNASGDSVEALASQWPNVLKYRQLMNQKPYIMKTSFQDDVYAKLQSVSRLSRYSRDLTHERTLHYIQHPPTYRLSVPWNM
ncbi:Glutathione S-transferase omega-1 [Sparganum proliferum]